MLKNDKKHCFVIMPFSAIPRICTKNQWDNIFEHIKDAVENSGLNYDCNRSEAGRGNIVKDIINDLNESDIVIADLTGQNANVFYELGVRHALRNRSILIAQHRKYIPSDLLSYAHHIYKWKIPRWEKTFVSTIKSLLKEIEKDPHRKDNPVEDYLTPTTERKIFLLATKKPETEMQREALGRSIQESFDTLDGIHKGRIPIEGGYAGHFNLFLDLTKDNKTKEEIKVYANFVELEKEGYNPFSPEEIPEIYKRLTEAVKEEKIDITHIFLLQSEQSLQNDKVQQYLKKIQSYSIVKLVFEDTVKLGKQMLEQRFILLTDHKFAFTHDRDKHANIVTPFLWMSEDKYEELEKRYSLIEGCSYPYPLKDQVLGSHLDQ